MLTAVIGWVCLVVSGTAMFVSFVFKGIASRPGYASHKDVAARLGTTLEFWAVLLAYLSAGFLFVDYSRGAPWSWVIPLVALLFMAVATIMIFLLVGSDPRLLHLGWRQALRHVMSRIAAYSRRNL